MFNKFLKLLAEKVVQEMKVYGVALPKNIPPEFFITQHAEHRLKERKTIGTKEDMNAHIYRAWYSRAFVPDEFRQGKQYQILKWQGKKEYRIYKKYLYIFDVRINKYFNVEQKHLITIFDISGKL